MELTSITTALAGLKKATEIVSVLVRGDLTLEKAELKLRLADLIGELANARTALVQTQQTLEENDKEIRRLQAAVRLRDDVVRHEDAYYSKGSDGSAVGDPYCAYCFESDGRLFHLTDDIAHMARVCPHCKHLVQKRRSYLNKRGA